VFAYATTLEGAPSLRILQGRVTMPPALDGLTPAANIRGTRPSPSKSKNAKDGATIAWGDASEIKSLGPAARYVFDMVSSVLLLF
jgi:hypothetical protein